MLYYSHPQIVLQEVPNEISLALSISGCPLHCKGCHSSETWKPDYGKALTLIELNNLIQVNKHITCILFYGGEWQPDYLEILFKAVKPYNLKICLYTGLEYQDIEALNLIQYLNYLKTGRYIQELGNLKSPTTNQKFYTLK